MKRARVRRCEAVLRRERLTAPAFVFMPIRAHLPAGELASDAGTAEEALLQKLERFPRRVIGGKDLDKTVWRNSRKWVVALDARAQGDPNTYSCGGVSACYHCAPRHRHALCLPRSPSAGAESAPPCQASVSPLGQIGSVPQNSK